MSGYIVLYLLISNSGRKIKGFGGGSWLDQVGIRVTQPPGAGALLSLMNFEVKCHIKALDAAL